MPATIIRLIHFRFNGGLFHEVPTFITLVLIMKNLLFILLISSLTNGLVAQNPTDIRKAMTGGQKVKVKPEYNFAGSLKFETTSTNKGKSYKGEQTWYFPKNNESIFGINMNMGQGKNMRAVIDYTDNTMIMFMEEQKVVMGMSVDIEKSMKDIQKDPKKKTSTPRKTGRTKTILGYSCDEWVTENADYSTSVWMSEKVPVASANFYKVMAQQLAKSTGTPMPTDMKGVPLEVQTTNKATNDKYSMVCKEVSNKPIKFSTSGYKTM